MPIHQPKLYEIVRRDPRYAYEAYEFIFAALEHTLQCSARQDAELSESGSRHVTGPELMHGARELALREFGMMARTVWRQWGINNTGDFGNVVFNLIESELMSKTSDDNLSDFQDVYDLDTALVRDFRLELPSDALGAGLTS